MVVRFLVWRYGPYTKSGIVPPSFDETIQLLTLAVVLYHNGVPGVYFMILQLCSSNAPIPTPAYMVELPTFSDPMNPTFRRSTKGSDANVPTFDAAHRAVLEAANGVYIVRMTAGEFVSARRVMLPR
jgi:hypothetical protein